MNGRTPGTIPLCGPGSATDLLAFQDRKRQSNWRRTTSEDPDQPVKSFIFAMDIDTADEIADQLGEVSDHVYQAIASLTSSRRTTTVQRNINKFGKCENGVIWSPPKMLDEGIDVPDAEVGINVAGLKRSCNSFSGWDASSANTAISGPLPPFHRHARREPPRGLDSKEYVQEPNWVRELGRRSSAADHRGGRRRRRIRWSARTAGTNWGLRSALRTWRGRLSKERQSGNSLMNWTVRGRETSLR